MDGAGCKGLIEKISLIIINLLTGLSVSRSVRECFNYFVHSRIYGM